MVICQGCKKEYIGEMESLVKEPQYPIARKIHIFPFFKIFQETKSLKNLFDNYFIISNILHNRKT